MEFVSSTVSNLLSLAFSAYGKQRLGILIYHRVLPEADFMRPHEPTAQQFDAQMSMASRYFNPLSLEEALASMYHGKLPERAICVTFDDGYADNATIAAPILKNYGIPFTVFVASSFLDGGMMWNDVVLETVRSCNELTLDLSVYGLGCHELTNDDAKASVGAKLLEMIKHRQPEERNKILAHFNSLLKPGSTGLMLTTDQLRALDRSGVEVGGHTRTHPILANLEGDLAHQEIAGGKEDIEMILGHSIRYFAYPNGQFPADYNHSHTEMARNVGYQSALSTQWGVNDRNSDCFQLARFTPWDKTRTRFLLRLHQNYGRLNA